MFQLQDELNCTLPSLVYEAEIRPAPLPKNTVQKIEKYLCKTCDKKGKVELMAGSGLYCMYTVKYNKAIKMIAPNY